MNIYKTTRYPRSTKRTEGVDRAWLLNQLDKAKHPTALLCIALHPAAPFAIAAAAKITEDLLIDFLFGKEELSNHELRAIGIALGNDDCPASPDYLLREDMNMIPEDELAEEVASALNAYRHMDRKHPIYKLYPQLLKMRPLPGEIPYAAAIHEEYTAADLEWANRMKPRPASLPDNVSA